MAIVLTVRDCSRRKGPRPEDLPGYDPDAQVLGMVAAHRLEMGKPMDADYEQLPELPAEYRMDWRRTLAGAGLRIGLGIPALVMGLTGWIPEWMALGLTVGAVLWALTYVVEVRR